MTPPEPGAAATTDLNKLVVELRAKTGAGMMDCKKALTAANGDFDAALTELRKKGLADAAKKSTRATKEGLVAFAVKGSAGAIVELNSETDFVARTPEFGALAQRLAEGYAQGALKDAEAAKALVQPVFEKLGENMGLRRYERFEVKGSGLIAGYVHLGGKIGALVELSAPGPEAAKSPALAEAAKELLLQIAAGAPKWLVRDEVPADLVAKEKEIHVSVLRKEGKPEAAIPKIVEGKLNKLFFQQWVLLDQVLLRDNKTPVAQLLKDAGAKLGGAVAVARFARYQLGE